MTPPKNTRNPRLESFEPMWTITDVADYLHISSKTVEKFRKAGSLPAALVFGRSVRWEPLTIRTWARGEVEAA